MTTNNDYCFIGVDIGLKTIYFSKITSKGFLIEEKKMASPKPLMPGATTVQICDVVKALDPHKKNRGIGLLLPRKAETNSRSIEKIIGLPGWLNVPLVDWLEIRLKTEVTILNSDRRNLPYSLCRGRAECCENSFRDAFVAAYMASQYFKCIDYSERNL